MNAFFQPGAELSSWKEIASYLDVSVKTAQRWERDRCLPVHRMPGGRGRVWADVQDLDAWKRSQPMPMEDLPTPPPEGKPSARPLRWKPLLAVAALTSAITLAVTALRTPSVLPFSVSITPFGFAALGADGSQLWRYNAASPLRMDWYGPEEQRGLSWVGDLDADGIPEVLFSPQTGDTVEGWVLLCFDNSGRERWRFKPGKTVRTLTGKTFAPPYGVSSVLVLPPGKDGQRRILVAAVHHLYNPTQVALLNAQGQLQREYWHSGHLHRTKLHTLSGRQVVLLAGLRNSTRQAALAVLDPETFDGAGKEPAAYQLAGMRAPIGVSRFVFQRTCINQELDPTNEGLRIISAQDGIFVTVRETEREPFSDVLYHFTNNLEFVSAAASSAFMGHHDRFARSATLDHSLTRAEIDALRPVRIE